MKEKFVFLKTKQKICSVVSLYVQLFVFEIYSVFGLKNTNQTQKHRYKNVTLVFVQSLRKNAGWIRGWSFELNTQSFIFDINYRKRKKAILKNKS